MSERDELAKIVRSVIDRGRWSVEAVADALTAAGWGKLPTRSELLSLDWLGHHRLDTQDVELLIEHGYAKQDADHE